MYSACRMTQAFVLFLSHVAGAKEVLDAFGDEAVMSQLRSTAGWNALLAIAANQTYSKLDRAPLVLLNMAAVWPHPANTQALNTILATLAEEAEFEPRKATLATNCAAMLLAAMNDSKDGLLQFIDDQADDDASSCQVGEHIAEALRVASTLQMPAADGTTYERLLRLYGGTGNLPTCAALLLSLCEPDTLHERCQLAVGAADSTGHELQGAVAAGMRLFTSMDMQDVAVQLVYILRLRGVPAVTNASLCQQLLAAMNVEDQNREDQIFEALDSAAGDETFKFNIPDPGSSEEGGNSPVSAEQTAPLPPVTDPEDVLRRLAAVLQQASSPPAEGTAP